MASMLLSLLLSLMLQTVEARSNTKRGSSSSKSSSSSSSSGSGSGNGGSAGVNLWADLLMACFVIFVVLAPSFFFRVNDTASAPSSRLPRRHRALSTRKER